MRYWAVLNNQAAGPFTAEQLKATPGVGPATMVCPEGGQAWMPAAQVPEIVALFAQAAPPVPPPPASPVSAASQTVMVSPGQISVSGPIVSPLITQYPLHTPSTPITAHVTMAPTKSRKKAAILLVLLLVGGGGAAYLRNANSGEIASVLQGEPKEIDWLDAQLHIGEYVKVTVPVLKSPKSERGAKLQPKPEDKTAFEVRINAEHFGAFPTTFDDDYWMKMLNVTGTIEQDGDQPFIMARSARHVEVVRQLRGKERGQTYVGQSEQVVPSEANLIDWKVAVDHIGEQKTVEGEIVRAGNNSAFTYFDFAAGQSGPQFSAVVPEASAEAFPDGFAKLYTGKKVRISGTIKAYKGNPQIYLDFPTQIEVVGEGAAVKPLIPSKENMIPADKAMSHIDEEITVEAKILSAGGNDKVTYLSTRNDKQPGFQVAIFESNYKNFPEGFKELYKGKKIWVIGKIETFKGAPQIVVTSPDQIRIVE